MKDLIKNIISAGITIGLSDREAFVNQVSGIISAYQEDPEKAEKWAGAFTEYLTQVKDDFRMERVIENSIGERMAGKKDISELTNAIDELTKTLKEKGDGHV